MLPYEPKLIIAMGGTDAGLKEKLATRANLQTIVEAPAYAHNI